MINYKITHDLNGNKIVKITFPNSNLRGFSIQTGGNLPKIHRDGVTPQNVGEITEFVKSFGTARQRELLGV